MTQLDNCKEPSQGPVGGSEAQEREAFGAAMLEAMSYTTETAVRSGFNSGAHWAQQYLAARATAAAPAAPVRQDGMTERERELLREIRVHFQSTLAPSWQDEAKALLLRLENAPAAQPPAAVGQALEALTRLWDKKPSGGTNIDSASPECVLRVQAAIAALSVQAEVPAVVDAPADAQRLDWLAHQVVTVRAHLRYGSRLVMQATSDSDEENGITPSDIRAAIDAAMRAADTKENGDV